MCGPYSFRFSTTELKRRVERLLRRGVEMPAAVRIPMEQWVIDAEEKLLEAKDDGLQNVAVEFKNTP